MVKFYEHQKDMVRHSLKHPHACYLADMGTGKTLPSVASFWYRKNKQGAKRCLVVCPVSVMENWVNEIKKYGHGLTASVVYGKRQKRLEALREKADFYIVNYDYLDRLKERLAEMKFDMFIADEITYVKHHSTLRSKALRFITKDIPYRLGLTGYPITQTPMDAFGEFLVIHPNLFGTNYWAFRNKYFKNVGRHFPNWVPIKSKLDDLAQKIGSLSIFVRKEDCLDLPEIVRETRRLQMTPQMAKDYKEMKDNLILSIKESGTFASAQVVLTKIMRLAQICSGFVKDEEGHIRDLGYNPKFAELKELLEGELEGRKVIVWCRFIYSIKLLARKFNHLRPATLYGATKDRQAELDKFQTDPRCKLFIGQVGTAFGYNLTASSDMIHYEQDFSIEKRKQAEGRNNRIGQTADKLTITNLVVAGSIDEYILKSLERKEDIANYVFDILGISMEESGVKK